MRFFALGVLQHRSAQKRVLQLAHLITEGNQEAARPILSQGLEELVDIGFGSGQRLDPAAGPAGNHICKFRLVDRLGQHLGKPCLQNAGMHLLSLVADRLWLVSDGTVKPYDGDLESYRALLLAREKPAAKSSAAKPAKPKRASRDVLIALRADVRKSEARVEKLSEMREKLDEKLADPDLYEPGKAADMAVWQKKHAECIEALERAEGLWMEALEKLEQAEAQ